MSDEAKEPRDREVWTALVLPRGRKAPGFHISTMGGVRRDAFRGTDGRQLPARTLTATPHDGYLEVGILGKTYALHVLVLLSFRGARPPGCEAAHTNDNGLDPRLSNLRWATPKGNREDKARLRGQREGRYVAPVAYDGDRYDETDET